MGSVMHNIQEPIQHFSSSEKVWYLFRQVKVHWKFAECPGHAARYSFQTEEVAGESNTAEDWKRMLTTEFTRGVVGIWEFPIPVAPALSWIHLKHYYITQLNLCLTETPPPTYWVAELLYYYLDLLLFYFFRPNNLALRTSVESWGINNI